MGSGTQQAVTVFSISFNLLAGFYMGNRNLLIYFGSKVCKCLNIICQRVPVHLVLFQPHLQTLP